jgi:peptidoglycan/LPS O-acetylase OafA/YrhL
MSARCEYLALWPIQIADQSYRKPIKLARAGNPEAALTNISQSAFRRTPRLVIPATIATGISWLLCQLGAYAVAHRSDSWWISNASPYQALSFTESTYGFVHNVIGTWTTGHNAYDDHQWTLLPLLKGSMMVYMTLYITIYMRPAQRMTVSAGLYVYYYICGDGKFPFAPSPPQSLTCIATFATQFFYGMFLSDLAQHPPAQAFISAHRWVRTVLPTIFITLGLYLASYPQGGFEWSAWSNYMFRLAPYITPEGADVPRYFSALGLEFVALGIHLSPGAQDFLASKYLLWLGKNSFAVYLIHGTLLRVVLTWFFYGIVVPPYEERFNDQGEKLPPPAMPLLSWQWRLIALPIWFAIVYYCAHLWTTYVDSYCARLTKKFEKYCFVESEKPVVSATAAT